MPGHAAKRTILKIIGKRAANILFYLFMRLRTAFRSFYFPRNPMFRTAEEISKLILEKTKNALFKSVFHDRIYQI
ncbi:hypothetical protein JOC77_004055 [Peribacillus deserti]|uniref:Uncharacterized protein n=1 Tax=Peribacillus deserti TaxID=673318 RepID=A0ABS2QN53_9BACI|nr:hypothetical protein [Peribacillus deserti]